jgi:hypothetical protein
MTTPTIPGATTTTRTRGRPKGTAAKTRESVGRENLVFETIAEDNRAALRRRRIALTPEEEIYVRATKQVYQEWVNSGNPGDWNNMPVKGHVVDKNKEADAIFFLRKGSGYNSHKLVIGSIQHKSLPDLPLPEGKVRIPFCVIARKTRVTGLPEGSVTTEPDSEE